jgi:hypothetical protein
LNGFIQCFLIGVKEHCPLLVPDLTHSELLAPFLPSVFSLGERREEFRMRSDPHALVSIHGKIDEMVMGRNKCL